jgi:predicted nucleic acid-binding Zn ribbon protein
MSTTTCPNCGKPLRPGAKFCGNCGATLPTAPPPKPAAAAPAPQPVSSVCPHCGKPIRPGARFCSSCGKTIEPAAPVVAPPAAPAAAPPASATPSGPPPGARPVPLGQPPSTPAAPPRAVPSGPKPGAPAPKRKNRTPLFLGVIGLLLLCVLVVVAGFFVYKQDPLGLWGKTPTVALTPLATTPPAAISPAVTTAVAPPATTVAPPVTQPPTVAPTTAVPAIASPTVSLSPTVTVEISPTASVNFTQTVTTAEPNLLTLFEDNFAQNPAGSTQWQVWGIPTHPVTVHGVIDELKLVEPVIGKAGLVSHPNFPISLAPGVEVQFTANLDELFSQNSIVFDWNPIRIRPDKNFNLSGWIRLQIQKERVTLTTNQIIGNKCEKEIDGVQVHIYRVRIIGGRGVELYLDDQVQPSCSFASIGLPADAPGSIAFTGLGWIIQVKAVGPPQP